MRRAAGLVLLVLAWRCVACVKDRPECYAGEYAGCTCGNGAPGYAACDPARDAWGTCVCDGTTPGVDASSEEPLEGSAADATPEAS